MDNETCLELESLIRDRTGLKTSRPIKPSNRLEDDLGLTGDEADDFMGKFFERFPVQPGDYAFTRYFSEEGFNLFEIVTMPFSKKTAEIRQGGADCRHAGAGNRTRRMG